MESHNENNIDNHFPVTDPYRYLKMSFSEMTEIMKGNLSIEELNDVKGYIDIVTHALMKREHERTDGVGNSPVGNIVSSNTNFKKHFKTHGTGFV